jgi:hypothetical protein
LNLILTVLVERLLGSIDPLNVKFSPPSRLKVEGWTILSKVHVTVSAVKVSLTIIIPEVLVKIGK